MNNMDFPKVELHVHLAGASRYETLMELALKKGLDVHGAKNAKELENILKTTQPATLSKVLEAFHIFLPCVIGDAEALERIAYELSEDQAKQGVVYFEARYSPYLKTFDDDVEHSKVWKKHGFDVTHQKLTPAEVIEAVTRGLNRGEADFGVKARSILSCICGHPDWNHGTLQLAHEYRNKGVVGLDVAGSVHGANEQYEQTVLEVFERAVELGIHRTVHAGESGSAKVVQNAIILMHAERIGHGYRVLQDKSVYEDVIKRGVHFEASPTSSVMTGSIPLDWPNHPIAQWAKDNVNFGINTDDPTCFGHYLNDELKIVHEKIGLSIEQLWQCQLNAAKSCFLPDDEKAELIKVIEKGRPASK